VPARLVRWTPWLWGALASLCFCRFFFTMPPGEMYVNHEHDAYVSRVVEFLALLRAGYVFPEWASDFRKGLGGPYFGYYQPGFFYLASAVATVLPTVRAIGVTLACLAFLGYAGTLVLVRERFGVAAGALAGTVFLASRYTLREVYLRGDFSEFAGMTTLPLVLWALTGWLEHGRPSRWRVLAVGGAALIVFHPAAALLGYGALGLVTLCYTAALRCWRRTAWACGAFLAGAGLAAFYWLGVALQWRLAQGELMRALVPYTSYFVDVGQLVALDVPLVKFGFFPVDLGAAVPTLVLVAAGALVVFRARATAAQWRLAVALAASAAVAVYMMTPGSAWAWRLLPLAPRIQFPFRFLLVATVATSAFAGCVPRGASLALLAGLATFVWSVGGAAPIVGPGRAVPQTTAEIAARWVAPDLVNEWLPQRAHPFDASTAPTTPRCEPACDVVDYARGPGRLVATVRAAAPALVTLPHYYFPVGWHATLDGAPMPLVRGPGGLMQVGVTGGGRLELAFRTTPGRRTGALVSALTASILLVLAALGLPAPH
jgi:hypothetical protein